MKTIGIKLADGSFFPVLQEGQPGQKQLELTTAHNNQTRVMVDLYRSSEASMDDAEYVDTLQIDNINEHPRGDATITFNVAIDENNELSANIVDAETGATSKTTIELVNRTLEERMADSLSDYDIAETEVSETEVLTEAITETPEIEITEDFVEPEPEEPVIEETFVEEPEVGDTEITDPVSSEPVDDGVDLTDFNPEDFALPETESDPVVDEYKESEPESEPEPESEKSEKAAVVAAAAGGGLLAAAMLLNKEDDAESEPEIEIEPETEVDPEIEIEESSDLNFDMEPEAVPDTDDFVVVEGLEEETEPGLPAFPDLDFNAESENTEAQIDTTLTDTTSIDSILDDTLSLDTTSVDTISDDSDFDLPDFSDEIPAEMDVPEMTTEDSTSLFDLPDFEDDIIQPAEPKSDLEMDWDFDDELTRAENSTFNSNSENSGLSFTGLYDKETELGDFEEEDDVKKRKTSVVICVICAIICIIAVLLILFVIPSKLNILQKNKKVEAPVPNVEVAVTEPEEEPEPIPEPEPEPVLSAKEDEIVIIEEAEEVKPEPPAPPKEEPKPDIIYKIKWGDTLWDIADTYYKNPWRYKKIARYNGIKDPDYIISGTKIKIPQE